MTFWCGSGSGLGSCYFVIDLKATNKKPIYLLLFLKVNLHHFLKIKVQKKLQNSRNQGFSSYFFLMIEGSGSISLTSGSGSGRPKSMWTRNTAPNHVHTCGAAGRSQCERQSPRDARAESDRHAPRQPPLLHVMPEFSQT
jgi:hypothetical protein